MIGNNLIPEKSPNLAQLGNTVTFYSSEYDILAASLSS